MEVEQPQDGDSDAGVLERLTNYFEQAEAPPAEEAVEASPPETEQVEDEQPDEEPAEEAATEEDGLVELVTDDGETYKVPQKLKDGYLRQSDYTKKTTDAKNLAETASFAIKEQTYEKQFNEWVKAESDELADLKTQIKQYKATLPQIEDINLGWRTQQHIASLQDRANELEKTLTNKKGQFDQEIAKARDSAVRNAVDFISRNVKGWKPDNEMDREIGGLAHSLGIPQNLMTEMTVRFPGFGVLAAKAALYEKLQANKPSVVKTAQKAPPVAKPGATTSTTSANAQKDKQVRDRFKKTGDTKDFARLLLQRGMVK